MALFQTSVLKKYLKQLDQAAVDKAYKAYSKYFLHPTIQENIRSSKEEQYQATFLNELFVNILGYTLNPKPSFNLTTELKNEKGAKKADGAILNKGGKAIAVIELKGTNTIDLESIRQQAFDYKANHSECVYVVTSNFEKLRFYIHNAVEHIEFNLFMLSPDRFALLYLCLQKEHILGGLPEKIKNDSVVAEEDITKKFYADYSIFKRELYRDLVKLNLKNEVFRSELTREDAERGQKNIKLTLFKKSQKLIDRFLFIFFAEDRGLLPPNSITLIINEYNQLKELDRAEPLYDTYKLYFKYLDQGRAGTDKKAEIFAYNGGLFQPDAVLDSMLISDDLLLRHTSKLTKYDFESQVDVNILGHIFENSLNEIESVNAEIEGTDFDKQKTKRKKDGVFYTPKYITKYIVDNTIGKLCEEKKAELKLEDEEYHKGRKNRREATLKELLAKLDTYREWLLSLTICDPACGSGAFLNQALDFLIREHTYLDELKQALLGGALVLSDIENTILERNIYGVDLNEESVEIAKLSLWLRTAQPRRKLNSLNNNIKCGNSLIDDKKVAGDKAFVWETEFPEVFAVGGFDVVIGNPPYVDIKALDENLVRALFKKYETTENRINLYSVFIEKSFKILKSKGYLSFINPNSILVNSSYTKIRKLLLKHMTTIVKLPDGVFKDAIVETIIFEFRKDNILDYTNCLVYPKDQQISFVDNSTAIKIQKKDWLNESGYNFNIYISAEQRKIINKIKTNSSELGVIADFTLGITPYDKYQGHSEEIIKSRAFHSDFKENETYKPLISGGNVTRYQVSDEIKEYIKYGDWLGAARDVRFFEEPRILVRQIVSGIPPRIYAGFTDKSLYYTQIGFGIIPHEGIIDIKVLLGLINSKLLNFYHKYSFLDLEKELFQKILIANCKKLPISKNACEGSNQSIKEKVNYLIEENKTLTLKSSSFLTYLQSQFGVQQWSKKMEKWYELEFGEFIKELNKAIKKEGGTPLTKLQEMDWMEVFTTKKAEAQALQAEIEKTDKKIDAMVYELYGLTEEEIEIVERS